MSKSVLQALRVAEMEKTTQQSVQAFFFTPKHYARNMAQRTGRNHIKIFHPEQ
jgi:hypothetical protein